MTDTHTHIYLREEFEDRCTEVLERGVVNGVRRMVFPNIDASSIRDMVTLAEKYPEETRMATGLHPTEVKENWREEMEKTLTLLQHPQCIAIGEVGIDLYWDKTYKEEQMDCLEAQLRVAVDQSMPVIIHCREGLDEVLEVFGRVGKECLPRVIFHSFTMDLESVRRIRKMADAYFGINGVVTFKNAESLRDALPEIGIDRILLETDSPYLAPVPYRGKRNESSYLPKICGKVAEVLGMTEKEVERVTDSNAEALFFCH